MVPNEVNVNRLLREMASGNQDAADQVMPLVYNELKRLARRHMRRERADHTLQTTALVHEAYLKLVQQDAKWKSRSHFFGLASQLMRRILVDYARRRLRKKRGEGEKPVFLNEALLSAPGQSLQLVKLNKSLQRLAEIDPRQSKVVELRFFGGLTVEQTAKVLGISPKTVKRDWSVAKAWLHGDLKKL